MLCFGSPTTNSLPGAPSPSKQHKLRLHGIGVLKFVDQHKFEPLLQVRVCTSVLSRNKSRAFTSRSSKSNSRAVVFGLLKMIDEPPQPGDQFDKKIVVRRGGEIFQQRIQFFDHVFHLAECLFAIEMRLRLRRDQLQGTKHGDLALRRRVCQRRQTYPATFARADKRFSLRAVKCFRQSLECRGGGLQFRHHSRRRPTAPAPWALSRTRGGRDDRRAVQPIREACPIPRRASAPAATPAGSSPIRLRAIRPMPLRTTSCRCNSSATANCGSTTASTGRSRRIQAQKEWIVVMCARSRSRQGFLPLVPRERLLQFLAQPQFQFARGLLGESDRDDLAEPRASARDAETMRATSAVVLPVPAAASTKNVVSRSLAAASRSLVDRPASFDALLDRAKGFHVRIVPLLVVQFQDAVATDGRNSQ